MRKYERIRGDLGWAMVEEVFDEIFPNLGDGPFSSIGKTMAPSEWNKTIKRGLERAFAKLLEEPDS